MNRSAWERLDAALCAARDGSERRRLLYEAMDLAERTQVKLGHGKSDMCHGTDRHTSGSDGAGHRRGR